MPTPVHLAERIVRQKNPAAWDKAAEAWATLFLRDERFKVCTDPVLLDIYCNAAMKAAAGIYEDWCTRTEGGPGFKHAFETGRARGQSQHWRILELGGPEMVLALIEKEVTYGRA